MKSWFNSDERIERLFFFAGELKGTPWCANSEAPGPRGGISCHNTPRWLLVRAGCLANDFPRITGDPRHSRALKATSIIEPFLDSRPEFRKIAQASEWAMDKLQPGDLLGIQIYHCLDHLGVVLSTGAGGRFIHTLAHKLTDIDIVNISPWSSQIRAAWRPIER